MAALSIADNLLRIHLHNWLLVDSEPLLAPSLLTSGFPSHVHSSAAVPTTIQSHRSAHILTTSAVLCDVLTRCLRMLDVALTDGGEHDLVLLDLVAPHALALLRVLRERCPDLPIVDSLCSRPISRSPGRLAPTPCYPYSSMCRICTTESTEC